MRGKLTVKPVAIVLGSHYSLSRLSSIIAWGPRLAPTDVSLMTS